jgi:hypothetical protein
MLQFVPEFSEELGIRPKAQVRIAQFIQRVRQRFGNEDPPIGTEMPVGIGQVNDLHF